MLDKAQLLLPTHSTSNVPSPPSDSWLVHAMPDDQKGEARLIIIRYLTRDQRANGCESSDKSG